MSRPGGRPRPRLNSSSPLATLAGLAWCWKLLLERALVNPPYAGSGSRKGGSWGCFALLPATPAGAVTARSLTYWLRDPRYSGSLVVVPLLPILLVFQGSQTGDYGALAFAAPLAAFLLAWSISADVSYDNTAFALHLATGVQGSDDRLGRALACLAFALPVVLIFAVGQCFFTGSWDALPGQLGLSLGILFTGLGLSSVVSARYTVAVPLPGRQPVQETPGQRWPDPGGAVRRHGGPEPAGPARGGPVHRAAGHGESVSSGGPTWQWA